LDCYEGRQEHRAPEAVPEEGAACRSSTERRTHHETRPSGPRRSLLLGTAAGAAGLLLPAWAGADEFPAAPITFICPWPPAAPPTRPCARSARWPRRVLKQPSRWTTGGRRRHDRREGDRRGQPDGYTIGQIPISVTRFSQLGTLQADPRKDFTFLARTSGQTFGIAVLPNSKFKTLKDWWPMPRPTRAA
jgi:hypothetical protein